jgi:TonB family protein
VPNGRTKTDKSGKRKSGWLWMPISLALNALSPGGTHLAATSARDHGPKPPRPNAAQVASATPSSAHPSPSARQKKRSPDSVKPAASHAAIQRAFDQPVAVSGSAGAAAGEGAADLPGSLRNPARNVAGRIGADGEEGYEAVETDDEGFIEVMPEDLPGRSPAEAQEATFYAGFAENCDPAMIESSRIPPSYPEIARQAGVQGKVLLEAVVRKDGSMGNISVLESTASGLGFDQAAVKAVSRWRYKPALQNGRPVDAHVIILVDFSPAH